jgi:hypothetical protein
MASSRVGTMTMASGPSAKVRCGASSRQAAMRISAGIRYLPQPLFVFPDSRGFPGFLVSCVFSMVRAAGEVRQRLAAPGLGDGDHVLAPDQRRKDLLLDLQDSHAAAAPQKHRAEMHKPGQQPLLMACLESRQTNGGAARLTPVETSTNIQTPTATRGARGERTRRSYPPPLAGVLWPGASPTGREVS